MFEQVSRRARVGRVGGRLDAPLDPGGEHVEAGAGARQQRPQPVGEGRVQAVGVGAVLDPVVAVPLPRALRVDEPVVDVGVGADRQQRVEGRRGS